MVKCGALMGKPQEHKSLTSKKEFLKKISDLLLYKNVDYIKELTNAERQQTGF